jgi:hypothetical protein
MKKVLVFALLVVAMGFAARRMVVTEFFTNTG